MNVVSLRAKIDPRDIFDAHERAVRICPDDNFAKFLRRLQTTLSPDRVSEFLATGNRFSANLPGWVHIILLLHRRNDVGDGDAELRELVRLHPEPHRVLTGAEDLDVADSRNARQLIDEIDVSVVDRK